MTRVIAGRWGGRTLVTPQTDATRPTSDKVREALFARLTHLGRLEDAHVLDLYAGSGALALEALSRGAATATAVESSTPVAEVIRENAAELGAGPSLRIHTENAATFAEKVTPTAPFDLIFCDPPYDLPTEDAVAVLNRLSARAAIAPDACIVLERSKRSTPPILDARFEDISEKTYGETTLWFCYAPAADDHALEGEESTEVHTPPEVHAPPESAESPPT